jgi:hydroxymethylpyrimidine pyrophosphatase-like HAD family hydrolase
VKFTVLVLDYDGTISDDGRIHPDVLSVFPELHARGIAVVLATGRVADDLRHTIGDLRAFDAVVAENGALIMFPASGRTQVLGPAPPQTFREELRRRNVELRAGECVVEMDAAAAPIALEVLRGQHLPLTLAFNRGRLMVLPQAVSKATGLREALAALRLSPHNAVAIGDAENDHALLDAVELGAAVQWGSEALQVVADEVVPGRGPRDLAPYLRELASQTRLAPQRIGRRALLLGRGDDGLPLGLAVRGRNVLIAGEPRSGKSWVAGLLCEQLVLHRYSVCVIDPEGDYRGLEALPGVIVEEVGEHGRPLRELARLLRYPDVSVVLDLSRPRKAEKRERVRAILELLVRLRRDTGLPHRVVVDEAHDYLTGPGSPDLLEHDLGGYTLVTYRVSALHPAVRRSAEAVIVTRESDPREIEALGEGRGAAAGPSEWAALLPGLELEEAILLPGAEEAMGVPQRFRIASRLTSHVRHREKYFDVGVPESRAFVFHYDGDSARRAARTLDEFAKVIATSAIEKLRSHLERGDFSRWVDDVVADRTLAAQIRELENQFRISRVPYIQDALVQLIRDRYRPVHDREARESVRGAQDRSA